MTRPLHIVFTLSAAASLREGLALVERDEEVVGLWDDWSYGPIDGDFKVRLPAAQTCADKADNTTRHASTTAATNGTR